MLKSAIQVGIDCLPTARFVRDANSSPQRNSRAQEVVVGQVLADIRENAPAGARHPRSREFVPRQWRETSRSWTALLGLPGWRQQPQLFVKFVRIGKSAEERRERAALEYDSLCQAFNTFSNGQSLAVPQPHRFYPTAAAFVTDYFDGISVTKLVSRANRLLLTHSGRLACLDAVRRCAQWLRLYHQMRDEPVDIAQLRQVQVNSLAKRLRFAEESGALSKAVVAPLMNLYVENAGDVAWACLEVGYTHHDFGPHNILVNPSGICVLDLGDSQTDFVMQDLARFCLELSILSTAPVLRSNRRFVLELREAFLDAYGASDCQSSMDHITTNIALALLLTARKLSAAGGRRTKWHRHVANHLQQQLESHARGMAFCSTG